MAIKGQCGPHTPSATIGDGNRYPGGKGLAGLHQWIIARLPSHVFYCEPFAGKAGIFRHKIPSLRSWLIDRDEEIITWLQRQIRPGIDAAELVTDDESAAGIVIRGEVPRALAIAPRQSRRAVLATTGDGIRFVELAAEWAVPDLLIYADPPYLMSTRVRAGLYRF